MYNRLKELEKSREPIRIGLIGAGMFGSQVVSQVFNMVGMRVSIIADKILDKALKAYELAGIHPDRVAQVKTVETANEAIGEDRPAVTEDSDVLIESDIDLAIEATGSTIVGARHAFEVIQKKKHVIMVNVETDIVVGPILKRMADNAGVVYSLVYGDQPALMIEHYEWAKTLGFEVVAVGRGSRYIPENRKKTPDAIISEPGWFSEYNVRFKERFGIELNPVMYNTFLDGTKPAVECTALSNSTGLLPDVDGMHFPPLGLRDIPDILSLKAEGGILENENVVETVTSLYPDGRTVERGIENGTFVVFKAPDDYLNECLRHYGVITGGKSKNSLLYRYVHLVGMEAPITVAKVALYHEPTGAPAGIYSQVACATKRELRKGTIIDAAGGGYTVYGYMVRASTSRERNLVPLGLSVGARLRRDVSGDYLITYDDIDIEESFALHLSRLQESHFSPKKN